MRAVLASMASALTIGALFGVFPAAGVASAQPLPPTPSADQLTGQLQTALDTGRSDSDRAATLAGGMAAVPTANNIANTLNRYGGMVNWQVQNPTLNGDQVDAQLAVTIPIFGTRTHNLYWVNQDGTWKLSNPSACVIARDVAGTDCTV